MIKRYKETGLGLVTVSSDELDRLEQENEANNYQLQSYEEVKKQLEGIIEKQAQELEVTRCLVSRGDCEGYCKNFEETGLYSVPDCDNEGLDTCKFEWNGREPEGGE